jgi:ferredoxin-type protein NapH
MNIRHSGESGDCVAVEGRANAARGHGPETACQPAVATPPARVDRQNDAKAADALSPEISKGPWKSYRWLALRRTAQLGFLALFLVGPWFGWWIVKGNLSSSRTLDVLPLTDPYVFLQSQATGHVPELTALIGAVVVLAAYLLVGGRAYCSWVCPVNLVTDAADRLRRRFNLGAGAALKRETRYAILVSSLLVSALTGVIAWELLNPVSILHRGLLYGMGLGWIVIAAIFLFDLLVVRHGWCGHLCPVGAFYALLGRASLIKVVARRRSRCNDCMDCYAVCPEPQVITPALKGAKKQIGPVVTSGACTNCGRCIDVCSKDVFEFGTRFKNKPEAAT